MRVASLSLALLIAAPVAAQPTEWHSAPEYDVLMRPHAYEPSPIRLEAGQPVKLRFLNQGQATFSFSAGAFFRAARIRSGDAEAVVDGDLQVAPGEQRVIALVPAPGHYRARSSNIAHRLLGMSVDIIVE